MSIYPLSPKPRTNANSPYNTWSCDSLYNTRSPCATRKQRLPCLFGASLEIVAVTHFSYRAPQHTAQQHIAASSLPLFKANVLLKSHLGKDSAAQMSLSLQASLRASRLSVLL